MNIYSFKMIAVTILGVLVLFVKVVPDISQRINGTVKDYNKPGFSAWDSTSFVCVEWLKNNLKDPDSLEIVACSIPEKLSSVNWEQIIKYRAKNSFGGYVVESYLFTFTKEKVISKKKITWNHN